MSASTPPETTYAMGYTDEERQRLIEQAGVFRQFTERLLVDAGIGPGMRVLDLGCGVGDVSLLLADLVGPDGSVVGVDKDPQALALARSRAGDDPRLTFVECDLKDLSFDETFDAAVGRLILLHLADPVATVRRASMCVRPGGIVAFQDLDLSVLPPSSFPELPLFQKHGEIMDRTFRRAGMEMQMGFKYRRVFLDAGLPEPLLRMERLLGGGPDFAGYHYAVETVRSILPLIEQFGIASAAEIDIDTLEARLRHEAITADAVISLPPLAGAWTRIPAVPAQL